MKFLFFMTLIFCHSKISGMCLDLKQGPIIIEAAECRTVNASEGSSSYKEFPDWVHSLDGPIKKKLLSGHNGILIRGKVTDSQTSTTNDLESTHLKGQTIKLFVHANQGLSCKNASKNLIQGYLYENCCDTGGTSPCLWDTSYFLKNPRPVPKGSALSLSQSTNDPSPRSKVNSSQSKSDQNLSEGNQPLDKKSIIMKADEFFKNGKFKEVETLLAKDWEFNINDPKWIWLLTQSLKKRDLCIKCIKPLELHAELYDQGELSLQEEQKIADSIFLLARCYAKTGKRDEAVNVLEGMLFKSKIFKKQIYESLNHPDLRGLQKLDSFKKYLSKIK